MMIVHNDMKYLIHNDIGRNKCFCSVNHRADNKSCDEIRCLLSSHKGRTLFKRSYILDITCGGRIILKTERKTKR